MTKKRRKQRPRRCAACGEGDKKLRVMVVQLDGRKELRLDLCRYCCAARMVLLRSPKRS